MRFPRQEYWSGLQFPSPGDLPKPVIECRSRISLALQADSYLLSHWGRVNVSKEEVLFSLQLQGVPGREEKMMNLELENLRWRPNFASQPLLEPCLC